MNEHKIKTVDVEELKNKMDSDQNLCLIDVRELDEWQALRIPGAIHIPKDTIPDSIISKIDDKNKPIYLHCHSGVRSFHAAQSLIDNGYHNVYSVDGGILDWARHGYPVEE